MIEGVTFTYLNEEQCNYIWDNMREHDKVETEAFGFTKENAFRSLQTCNETVCGLKDDVPVAIFGFITTPGTIRFNFLATKDCEKYWLTITKIAKSYIKYNINNFPQLRPIIEVWEGHTVSRRWLKLFGFEETKAYRFTPKGKMIFMEYNKYKQNKEK